MGDRYFLFTGESGDEGDGGMDDYKGAFASIDEAKDFASSVSGDYYYDYAQIATIKNGELVEILYREYDHRSESLYQWITPKQN